MVYTEASVVERSNWSAIDNKNNNTEIIEKKIGIETCQLENGVKRLHLKYMISLRKVSLE